MTPPTGVGRGADAIDPRRVAEADVLVDGVRAATLRRDSGGTVFAYADDYLAAGGVAVATTLPLAEEPVRIEGGGLPPYFSGLLPEGRRLTALRTSVKTSADDELSLLIAVGADPVGNVQVVPSGTAPQDADAQHDGPSPTVPAADAWEHLDFGDLLDAAGIDPSALAGVQDKVSGRMLTVPLLHEGRFHLLKLDPPEYPHVVENEAYFLGLARALRQPVVDAEVVHDREGRRGLLVTRFDRVMQDGQLRRLAVEDGAQLLGRYPADKYSVTTEALLDRIGEVATARLPAIRSVLHQLALAWLTGNGDLHAKNVSLMKIGREWRPSPIYDIPSTLPYGDHRMALSVAGRDDSLSRRRFVELAEGAGLTSRVAERALDDVLAVTGGLDEQLEAAFPMTPRALRDMRRVLARRRRELSAEVFRPQGSV